MAGQQEEVTLTYSIVLNKKGEKEVQVRFERPAQVADRAIDYAEGVVPACMIQTSEGFTSEEVGQLEDYLKANMGDIIKKAKEITKLSHWL